LKRVGEQNHLGDAPVSKDIVHEVFVKFKGYCEYPLLLLMLAARKHGSTQWTRRADPERSAPQSGQFKA
jgi:hypothetical protein